MMMVGADMTWRFKTPNVVGNSAGRGQRRLTTMDDEKPKATSEGSIGQSASTTWLERPSMRCMICGRTAYARDIEIDKYGKSHYDCESGGHSFYPRAVDRAL